MKETKQLLICLSIITFLGSCTVQKRVHMPGYHFQFGRHKASFTKIDQEIEESRLNTSSQNNEIIAQDSDANPSIEENLTEELTKAPNEHSFEKGIYSTKISEKITQANQLAKSDVYHTFQKKTKSVSNLTQPEGRSNGVTILIMSILFFLLAFIFFYYLGVIGLIFSIIFLVAGSLLFILGLFRLIFS